MTEAKESSAVSSPEPADEFSKAGEERKESRRERSVARGVPALAAAVSGAIESNLWWLRLCSSWDEVSLASSKKKAQMRLYLRVAPW